MKKGPYICDRCGKEKPYDTAMSMKIHDKIIDGASWLILCSKTRYRKELDLCENCLHDFYKWFNMENAPIE